MRAVQQAIAAAGVRLEGRVSEASDLSENASLRDSGINSPPSPGSGGEVVLLSLPGHEVGLLERRMSPPAPPLRSEEQEPPGREGLGLLGSQRLHGIHAAGAPGGEPGGCDGGYEQQRGHAQQ